MVQLDEPVLALNLSRKQIAIKQAYNKSIKHVLTKYYLATYFEGLKENLPLAVSLPVSVLHVDLVRCPEQLDDTLKAYLWLTSLSLGLVDGKIYGNSFEQSL